jgi:hypothetical protein
MSFEPEKFFIVIVDFLWQAHQRRPYREARRALLSHKWLEDASKPDPIEERGRCWLSREEAQKRRLLSRRKICYPLSKASGLGAKVNPSVASVSLSRLGSKRPTKPRSTAQALGRIPP